MYTIFKNQGLKFNFFRLRYNSKAFFLIMSDNCLLNNFARFFSINEYKLNV